MNQDFLSALYMIFEPNILFLVIIGVIFGILIGSMPGLTATMAIAILTSFTFGMDSMNAITILLGVYGGGVYGGSISAILLHIPGTPSAIMTAQDGYPMSKKGMAGAAIGISTVSSFLGGLISVIILILASPLITKFSLKFSAPEYFALAVFGLSIIANISGKSLLKGFIAATLGILISTVGLDPLVGIERFTFNSLNLQTGLNFVAIMIGLFGLSEMLEQLRTIDNKQHVKQEIKNILPTKSILKRIYKVIFRSSLIGTFIGALPGAGGSIASFVAYNDAKQSSKNPEQFGTGIPEGIAAPESANNATVGGALMPLLTLGVPGDAITAILIGAFMIHNIQPGPMLFQTNANIIYSIYLITILANIILLIAGLSGAKLFAKVINIRINVLLPIILLLSMLGSFATNNSYFDILAMIFFGIVGFILIKLEVPIAPMVLGIVLGPMAETNFRTALVMSQNDFSIFFTRPIPLIFWSATLISLALPYLKSKKSRG